MSTPPPPVSSPLIAPAGDAPRSATDAARLAIPHALAWFLGAAVLYWAFSKLGLLFTGLGPHVSVCWPGAGLALGLMVVAPRRAARWICLGVFTSNLIANLTQLRDLWTSGGYALVNALEPLLAAALLRPRAATNTETRFDLREPTDLLRLCLLGAALPCALGAAAGTLVAYTRGATDPVGTFRTWWAADALGVLLVAPMIIGWTDFGSWPRRSWWRLAEAAAVIATTLALSAGVFTDALHIKPAFLRLPAPILPALLWAGLRFGVSGASIASVAAAAVAIAGTRAGHGPFYNIGRSPAEQLTLAQGTFAIFGLAVQAAATALRAWRHRAALLRQERRNTERAFDRSPVGMAVIAPDHRLTRINSSLCSLVGAEGPCAPGAPIADLLQPEDAALVQADLRKLAAGAEVIPQRLVGCRRRDGTAAYAQLLLTAVRDDAGRLVHFFAQFVDVTRERLTKQALRESENRLKLSLGNAGHGLWDWDIPSGACVLDSQWEVIHGYAPGEMPARVEMWEATIHPEDRDRVYEILKAHLADDSAIYDADYRAKRKDGSWVWINTRGRVQSRDDQGRPVRMMGTIHNISERKAAEERLRQSVRDKEVLLREIHHRVKNNLTAVSGLLLLRSNQTDNPEFRAAFAESRDRVRSIALVHDTLHRSDNLDRVDLSAYLRSLATQVAGSLAGGSTIIAVTVSAQSINLDINTAVPCGLIVNEMLTNCYKHAFTGRAAGRITVEATAHNDLCTIIVRDDGIGSTLPDDESKTLGLRLMKALAAQIGGEVRFRDAQPGLEGQLTFALKGR